MKLKIENVSKSFKSKQGSVEALRDVSFEVASGEFLCLLGPSGCGKSTMLNLIAGLDKVSGGTIYADGVRLGAVPQPDRTAQAPRWSGRGDAGPAARPGMEGELAAAPNGGTRSRAGTDRVMMFQDPTLFPWLNVLDNVSFGLAMANKGAKERREIAEHYLQMVHLTRFRHAAVHELSGGMKQRVALARALALDPAALLMDEPFAALDAQTRDLLHVELQEIWATTHKTIVFVTHNVREAIRLGDRVLLMSARPGRVKSEFPIRLPRPRELEDHALVDLARVIVGELKTEVNRVLAEEVTGAAVAA